jgi:6-phosphogluconolactonase (cycloisomerase 2 family)
LRCKREPQQHRAEVSSPSAKTESSNMNRKSFLQLAALTLALLPASLFATDDAWNTGAVYTMDNATNGNRILTFQRAADGSLSPAASFTTGGVGTGGGLGNQGGVILSPDGRWLFACNAASHDISVFLVTPHGLRLTHKVGSRGRRPVSLTLHRNLLYVLNAGGGAGDKDNLSGFLFFLGRLHPLPNSTHPLSGDNTAPAQIEFSKGGDFLVVTEKATQNIDVFTLDDDGRVDSGKSFTAAAPTPFGFAFSPRGHLIVSEAVGGMPDASVVSSYDLSDDGNLSVISPAVPTTETAACWIVITRNSRFAYTSNTGSGTISGYALDRDGRLTLLDADGITGDTGAGSGPIDMALSRGSRFLFSLNGGNGTLSAFRVNADGALTALPGVSGIPAGANGLAAR